MKRRVRVGIVVNTYYENVPAAGGHLHFLEVARCWPSFDLVVFAPEVARAWITRELPNAQFVALPNIRFLAPYRQIDNLCRAILVLSKWRVLRRCDVLIATSHFMPDVLSLLAARKGGAIVTIHHIVELSARPSVFEFGKRISQIFQTWSLSLARRLASVVFVNGMQLVEQARIDSNRQTIVVITHGVNHIRRASDAAKPRGDRPSRVLFLGRLVPAKGVHELLLCWAEVIRHCAEAELTIAGRGDERYERELRSIVSQAGINSSVHFVGFVSNADRDELLASADVFVFPSHEEGWGIAVAEAMVSGLPVVTYDLPVFTPIFPRGRITAPLGDVSALAGAIIRLLTDPLLNDTLAAEARELGLALTWANAASIEEAAIFKLVSVSGSAQCR